MSTDNFNNTDWKTATPVSEAGLRKSLISVPTASLTLLSGTLFEGGQHKHVATYTLDAGKKFNIVKLPKRLGDQFFNIVVRWITTEWVDGLSVNTNHAYMLYADDVTKWSYKLYDGQVIHKECIFDVYITNPTTFYRSIEPVVIETSINITPAQNYTISDVAIANEVAVTGDDVLAQPYMPDAEMEIFEPRFIHVWRAQLELPAADYYLRDEVGILDLKNLVTGQAPAIGIGIVETNATPGTVLNSDGSAQRMHLNSVEHPGGLKNQTEMWFMFQTVTGVKSGITLASTSVAQIGYSGASLYWNGGIQYLGDPAKVVAGLDDDTWFIARFHIVDLGPDSGYGDWDETTFRLEIRDLADKVAFSQNIVGYYNGNGSVAGWEGTNNVKFLATSLETFTDDEAERLWKFLRGKYSTWVLGLGALYDEEPPTAHILIQNFTE